MEPLALIVAVAKNGVIGKEGGLPWRIPEDLRHFKQLTTGHAMIMGRKTYESIGRPLPNRRSIVVTRNRNFVAPGCEVAGDVAGAIAMARPDDAMPFIIGGGEIYRLALPMVTRVYLTTVDRDAEGDTRFPELDRAAFREVERRAGEEPGVTFVTLERIS